MIYNLEQIAVGDTIANSPWAAASDLERESYRHGVQFALVQNPGGDEDLQHAEWMRWRAEHNLPHPSARPRGELRPQERDKDGVFLAVVRRLAQ